MIKIILVGTGLFGAGVAAGYFISRKILEGQYQCDVAEIRELYQEKLAELEELIEAVEGKNEQPEKSEEYEDDDDDLTDEEEQEAMAALAVYRGERRRSVIEYNKPNLDTFKSAMREVFHEGVSVITEPDDDGTLGDIDEDDESSDDPEYDADLEREAEDYARRRTENMKKGDPYLIEPEEYREGPEGYSHQSLYYYAHDRTLCEDDDSEVEDEEAVVGLDYEDKLDMQTTCWVRNDTLEMLYEIHRIDDSYKKTVQNAAETPREREFRLQGRRKQALDDNFRP
jgi:hypothetical protein